MTKYPLKKQNEDVGKKVDKILDGFKGLDKLRKLDEQNPMEQAEKYDAVKKNPPQPGYMKVDMFKAETSSGEPCVISESKQGDGTIKKLVHDQFFTVDLNTCIAANIAACPSNVVPRLIDQAQRLAIEKKGTFKLEKRQKEWNWWWVVFILLILAPVFSLIIMLL